MIYFLKGSVPVLALASLFDPVYDQANAILDVIALAAIFGSVLTYNRIKASLVAAESSGKSWREERDASLSHATRLSADLASLTEEKLVLLSRVSALEARPDLTRLEGLVAESTASMKNHEVQAGQRAERLIAAIERLAPAT